MTYRDFIQTPIGGLAIRATEDALVAIDFDAVPQAGVHENRITRRCRRQLQEYFAGRRQVFDLPIARQGTEFQNRVWQALREIPFGATCSYLAIAALVGNPKAVRAVGAANGRNPIPIVVPCHRVIGAGGSLVGFGGGLERKKWLLDHEAAIRGSLDPGKLAGFDTTVPTG